MTLLITGSRNTSYKELRELEDYLLQITKTDEAVHIIAGGAKGPDSYAAILAEEMGWKMTEMKPDYARYGKAAPLVRNDDMIALCKQLGGQVIAWQPHGSTPGTSYTIKTAQKAGLRIAIKKNEKITHTNPCQLKLELK